MSAQNYAAQIREQLGDWWLPRIYRDRVLSQRTRSYSFEGILTQSKVSIQHTLLGVELKLGRKRLLCPDLATARYLSVFARAGCNEIAIPYDITKVSQLADALESSWYRMLVLVDAEAQHLSEALRTRVRGLLFAKIRSEIAEAGAGTRMPEFKQMTKQGRS